MNKFGLIPGNGNFDLDAIGNLVLELNVCKYILMMKMAQRL